MKRKIIELVSLKIQVNCGDGVVIMVEGKKIMARTLQSFLCLRVNFIVFGNEKWINFSELERYDPIDKARKEGGKVTESGGNFNGYV